MFGVPTLFRRILPDPVAFLVIEQGVSRHAAVVGYVPAHGVEDKLSVRGAMIFVRPTANDIIGQRRDKIWKERVEILRILPVGQPIAFKGASDGGFIHGDLGRGRSPGYVMQRR